MNIPRGVAGPIRPLTKTQSQVAALVAIGTDYGAIANALGMTARTARVHVHQIAQLIPNPDDVKPYTLVLLWAAHEKWERERESAA